MAAGAQAGTAGAVFAPRADAGPTKQIAIVEASDGVLLAPNTFDLQGKTLTFTAAANGYRYSLTDGGYEDVSGTGLSLADDDASQQTIGFSFPFFGRQYDRVYVNSDGNLTFGAPDTSISERSLGRFSSGPPRIAPLFDDLDPSQPRGVGGVIVNPSASRLVVTWKSIPEYGTISSQTFQVRLYPDGKIEFAWASVNPTAALVGISPGNAAGSASVVNFDEPSGTYTTSVAERFGSEEGLDFVTIAQRFYATHDDSYDYVVIFNGLNIKDSPDSVASTRPVRVRFSGHGDGPADYGGEFGSPSRLQAVIHMADPDQYPDDLRAPLTGFGRPSDTSISVLAHEVGHLWLAYASVRDSNPEFPMLSQDFAHWRFTFNSDASLLEGHAIQDSGLGTSPRFRTVRATERFAPLDLYLMGLLAPWDVEPVHPMFYVANSGISGTSNLPRIGFSFNGERRDVSMADLLAAEGRRTPDHTVSQKHFRVAFIHVVRPGEQPNQAELDKVERFRAMFADYFRDATGGRASADVSLKRSMQLSVFPAAGVVRGSTATATITLETPPEAQMTISLGTSQLAAVPGTMTIPAGATSATFTVQGVRSGVDELTATPSDTRYETARSNIQVLDSAAGLRLAVVSGGDQLAQAGAPLREPVVLRVVDENNLPYQGIRVQAIVSQGGTLAEASATSDPSGYVRFNWTPGLNGFNELKAKADGGGPETLVYAWSKPAFQAAGVVNAASFAPDVAVGSLASLFGVNLAATPAAAARLPLPTTLTGVRLLVDGQPAPLLYVSPLQINFQVPVGLGAGPRHLIVENGFGESEQIPVNLSAIAPAIFDDPAAGVGAIHVAGQTAKTNLAPAKANAFIEIYATGLGQVDPSTRRTVEPVRVLIDGSPVAQVDYAGLSGNFVGLYQVNALLPAGTAAGRHRVALEIAGKRSKEVFILVQ